MVFTVFTVLRDHFRSGTLTQFALAKLCWSGELNPEYLVSQDRCRRASLTRASYRPFLPANPFGVEVLPFIASSIWFALCHTQNTKQMHSGFTFVKSSLPHQQFGWQSFQKLVDICNWIFSFQSLKCVGQMIQSLFVGCQAWVQDYFHHYSKEFFSENEVKYFPRKQEPSAECEKSWETCYYILRYKSTMDIHRTNHHNINDFRMTCERVILQYVTWAHVTTDGDNVTLVTTSHCQHYYQGQRRIS